MKQRIERELVRLRVLNDVLNRQQRVKVYGAIQALLWLSKPNWFLSPSKAFKPKETVAEVCVRKQAQAMTFTYKIIDHIRYKFIKFLVKNIPEKYFKKLIDLNNIHWGWGKKPYSFHKQNKVIIKNLLMNKNESK